MNKSLILLTLLSLPFTLPAQLYFDTNGTTSGTSVSFTGTDGSNWNSDSTGGAGGTISSWTPGANMVFSAGTNGTSGQTLSLANSTDTGGITVDEGQVSIRALTSGQQSLTVGSGGITVNGGAFFRPSATLGQGAGPAQGLILSASQSFTNNSSVADGGIWAVDVINQAGQNVTLTIAGTGAQTIVGNALNIVTSNTAGGGNLHLVADTSSTVLFQGLNTYQGNTTLKGGSGVYVVDNASSATGTSGSPTNGAFGRGTVTLTGSTVQMRSRTGTNNHFYNSTILGADMRVLTTGTASDGRLRVLGPVTISGASRTVNVDASSNPATVALLEFASTVSDGGSGLGLTKQGLGTLLLSGTTSYSGNTEINAGDVRVSGTLGAASAVNINSGGTLSGTGSAAGSILLGNGGTLAPGSGAIGTLSTGALTTSNGGTLAIEFNTNLVTTDSVLVSGNLNLSLGNGTLLSLADLGSNVPISLGTSLTLIDYSGAWNGGLLTYSSNILQDDEVFAVGSNSYQISYNGATILDTTVTLTTVPEPAAILLLTCGLMVVTFGRKRTGAGRI